MPDSIILSQFQTHFSVHVSVVAGFLLVYFVRLLESVR